MKYTLKSLIIVIGLLFSMTATAQSSANWFNKSNQKTQTSHWSPVTSDVTLSSSHHNNDAVFSTRRYSSGGAATNANVTTRSNYSTDHTNTQSVRGNSFDPSSSRNNMKSQYGNVSMTSSFNADGISNIAANDFFNEDGEETDNGRSGQQRVRGNTHDDNGNLVTEGTGIFDPYAPLSDAIPCLVVMILAFAVIKYRKLH